ncbi:MAG: IS200/IS605 family transposase [Thermoguttaceae bacterium]|nr:IS200/IS605 family transposase [Thermoguttaceae bacterium]
MSYTQLCYHIIFGTKYSKPTINKTYKKKLYAYIWGIVKKYKGTLMRIGGVDNHVHMFCSIPPKISISEFVKTVKGSSSAWLQNTPENKEKFPDFRGWAEGYCALTYAFSD